MNAFIAKLRIRPGREAEFERLARELSETAHREEPGLLAYDVIRHTEDASNYVFYARFRDADAFEAHQQADFHRRLVPSIMACVEGEMDLQFFDWIA